MDRSRPVRLSAAEFRAVLAGRRCVPETRATQRAWADRARESTPEPVRVLLPFLPPSVNKLFSTVRDRNTGALKRVLTAHARRVRRLVLAMVQGRCDPDRLYEMHMTVHLKAFTAAGAVRKVDLTNRVKFLEDCVCAALGIDDSRIFRVVLVKVDSAEEQTVIEMRALAGHAGRRAA
jgi:Holliday junction resolvase RusA-like endonuclease